MATLVLMLLAPPARALVGANLRDLADPVPPGAELAYEIRLVNLGLGTPICFNPAPACVVSAAICYNPAPVCVGDAFIGFVCDNAANQGGDCGVGDPPVPDVRLCIPKTNGVCIGGTNGGFPCAGALDCPGTSTVCVRAFNEGANCGVGEPPSPVPGFCLPKPNGICSGGPSFGLPCTAPHGTVTDECPPDPTGPVGIAVTLPVPPGTTFIDATAGGEIDGTTISWALPPLVACGVAGTPQCPALRARFTVDPAAVVGTTIALQATAVDGAGEQLSAVQKTEIGTFGLRALVLTYPNTVGRDRFAFRTVFHLPAGGTFDPATQPFNVQVTNAGGTIIDLGLGAGQLQPSATGVWQYKATTGGLNNVVLRELYPGFYSLVMRAKRLDLPDLLDTNVTYTVTAGANVMSESVTMVPKNGGKRFIVPKD